MQQITVELERLKQSKSAVTGRSILKKYSAGNSEQRAIKKN